MLNFDEFCLKVKEEFMNYMSADFRADGGYFIEIKDITAAGKKFKALYINGKDKSIKAPVIPLEPVYENVFCKKHSGNAEAFLKELAATYEGKYIQAMNDAHKTPINENQIRIDIEKVFFVVINYEANKEELEAAEIPFSKEGDLAIVYRVLIDSDENSDGEIKSILINKAILNGFIQNGYDLDKIKAAAVINTEKLFPEKLVRLSEDAYMLTSQNCCFGSNALLYKNSAIKELAERTNKNILIFPCSINTSFILLVDEDVVRAADIYSDEISQYYAEMGEPVLNTQVMMYSCKEKKLLFGEDVLNNNIKSRRKVASL